MCLVGLKFRHPETNKLRGVRIQGEAMFPPAEEGWGIHTYFCVRYGYPHLFLCKVRYPHLFLCKVRYPHLFLCKVRYPHLFLPGLALKNPPKKTHPKKPTQKTQKTHLKKTTKSVFLGGFFGFFKIFYFYENNKNFSLSNRFFMNK